MWVLILIATGINGELGFTQYEGSFQNRYECEQHVRSSWFRRNWGIERIYFLSGGGSNIVADTGDNLYFTCTGPNNL